MKSLEIFNFLLAINEEGRMSLDNNIYETIKQDLEVLEIIVNKSVDIVSLEISSNFLTYRCMVGITKLTNKEYEKLKQWLEENENDR